MISSSRVKTLLAAAGLGLGVAFTGTAAAQSAFTYQGVLEESGSPVTGLENIRFRLFDAETGGSLLGETTQNVDVDGGVFTTQLNFGPLSTVDFADAWLEIAVNTGSGFETLGRQQITAAPYALNTRGMEVEPSGQVSFTTNSPLSGAMFIENTSGSGFAGTYFIGPSGNLDGYVGVTSGGPATWIGGDGMQIGSTTGQDVIVTTGPAERMRITSSGDVGIGTSTPAGGLSVTAGVVSPTPSEIGVHLGRANADEAIIELTSSAGSRGILDFNAGAESGRLQYSSDDDSFGFFAADVRVGQDLNVDGNVGIGTTNLTFPLTIDSDPAGNTVGLRSNAGGSDWHFDFASNGLGIVETGLTERVRLNDGGNVTVPTGNVNIPSGGVVAQGQSRFGRLFSGVNATTQIFAQPSDTFAMVVGDSSGIFRFSVNNNGDVATQCGIICASDERLKEDITNLETPLDKIMALRGVSFTWKDETLAERGTQLGFVAQEVQEVLPELIGETPDGMLGVDYASLTSVLTGAVQEQQTEIETMQQQIAALEATMESMQAQRSVVGASMVWPVLLGGGVLGGLAVARRRQMKDATKA